MSLNNSVINFKSIKEAYEFYNSQCDKERPSSIGTAVFFITAYSIAASLQMFILPTNYKLAKQFSAFQLLMYINSFNIIWLFQYIWLCIETLIGIRLRIHSSLDAYLFRFVNFCIDFLYMHLALNRSMAVLDTHGNLFNIIFDKKKNKIYITVTLFIGFIYSIHSNWFKQRRPFHCLNVVDYFEPSTGIPPVLPTIHINSIVKTITVANSLSKNSSLNSNLHLRSKNDIEQKEEIVYANLAFERSRLFLLCFFSQLPYLLANARYPISRLIDIGGNFDVTISMSKLAQFFGTIFHVQEPFLLLLLSRDMRRGVYKNYLALKKRFLKIFK
ncbi:hypothetical protein Mgra_00008657 [Meloidogyne graminicola]|uniref:Uncharacterized protein n=1 Tax=Meloidogyne graminicola TaxID=189291 RepID=A0A8S9ZF93_9BILA|nr:hypothetical protein Mgra_00008657 [Meloidogyne graminicola]